ncbi:Hypothetical Protein FCC1311_083572 [Hondaea fermentalgiana]|uniref:BRCT domain-containing protein n=1 Tax=Hondaea fermentalgiana TaxID=2315210 RepID=A0A2R5GMK5_9STRA|nr:Hypothetical Protein FCC1311_083572 [Hondaea fermentalgiana]|eukprot:GBG32132.1 Hypothetical Protein FCC1311_083572 [Hondaea fermentalgiana]
MAVAEGPVRPLAWRVEVFCLKSGAPLRPDDVEKTGHGGSGAREGGRVEEEEKKKALGPRYWLLPGKTEVVRKTGNDFRDRAKVESNAKNLNVDHLLHLELPEFLEVKARREYETYISRKGNLTLIFHRDGSLQASAANRKGKNKMPSINGVSLGSKNELADVPSGATIVFGWTGQGVEIAAKVECMPAPYVVGITGLSIKDKAAAVNAAARCPPVCLLKSSNDTRSPTLIATATNPKIASAKMLRALVENVPLVDFHWLPKLKGNLVCGLPAPSPFEHTYEPQTQRMQQAASQSTLQSEVRHPTAPRSQMASQGFSNVPRSIYLPDADDPALQVSYALMPRRRTLFKGITFVISETQAQVLAPILESAGAHVENLVNLDARTSQHVIVEKLYARLDAGEHIIALRHSGALSGSDDTDDKTQRLLSGIPRISNAEVSTHILCAQGLDFSGQFVKQELADAGKIRSKVLKRPRTGAPRTRSKAPSIDLYCDDDGDGDDDNDGDDRDHDDGQDDGGETGVKFGVKSEPLAAKDSRARKHEQDETGVKFGEHRASEPTLRSAKRPRSTSGTTGTTLSKRRSRLKMEHPGQKVHAQKNHTENDDDDDDDDALDIASAGVVEEVAAKEEKVNHVVVDDDDDDDDDDDGPFGSAAIAEAQSRRPRDEKQGQDLKKQTTTIETLKPSKKERIAAASSEQIYSQGSQSSSSAPWESSNASRKQVEGSRSQDGSQGARKGRVYFRKARIKRAAVERPFGEKFVLIRCDHAYRS